MHSDYRLLRGETAKTTILALVGEAVEDIIASKPPHQHDALRTGAKSLRIPKGKKTVPHEQRTKSYIFGVGNTTYVIPPRLDALFKFARQIRTRYANPPGPDKPKRLNIGRLSAGDLESAAAGEALGPTKFSKQQTLDTLKTIPGMDTPSAWRKYGDMLRCLLLSNLVVDKENCIEITTSGRDHIAAAHSDANAITDAQADRRANIARLYNV